MSIAVLIRCIICTLYYKDELIHAERLQIKNHIYYDHDYTDKLKSARAIDLIGTNEKRSADWLSAHLAELSIISLPHSHPSKSDS